MKTNTTKLASQKNRQKLSHHLIKPVATCWTLKYKDVIDFR